MMELIKHTNIDFLGLRKYAFVFSIVMSLLGVACIVMIATGNANMGIDFVGGATADLMFAKPVHIDQARSVLDNAGFKGAEVQSFSDGNKLMIRVKKTDIPIEQVVDKIKGAFVAGMPDNTVSVDSSSAIGPTVGKALQVNALKAVIFSMLAIIIYIGFRFEYKFGLAATVATFHDILAVLGVFLVLNLVGIHKEITLLVVTALLTLAGYSLTDTVVVFDRIRENLRARQKDSLADIINFSINEVLSRTIVTSMTVFLTVLALFFFGGEVLHDFAFAMLIGVMVGTYSSIFVASPLLFVWRGSKGTKLIKAAMLTKQPVKFASAAAAGAAPAAPSAPTVTEKVDKPASVKPAKVVRKGYSKKTDKQKSS